MRDRERKRKCQCKQASNSKVFYCLWFNFLQFIYDGFLTFLFDLHAAIFVSLILFNG
jgi:hypothetical protein